MQVLGESLFSNSKTFDAMNTEFLWPFLLVSCIVLPGKVKASQTPARVDSIKLLFIVFVRRENRKLGRKSFIV